MERRSDDGYASLTTIVLCAVAALLCAGLLSLTRLDHRRAMNDIKRLQQEESLNGAIMQAAVSVALSPRFETIRMSYQDQTIGPIEVRAEPESLKWPVSKIDEIDETALSQKSNLSLAVIKQTLASAPKDKEVMDDCIRSLFSELGLASTKAIASNNGPSVILTSSKEGSVWRIRATSKDRVQEQLIRFTGDSRQFYAIVSREDYSLGQLRTCQYNRG